MEEISAPHAEAPAAPHAKEMVAAPQVAQEPHAALSSVQLPVPLQSLSVPRAKKSFSVLEVPQLVPPEGKLKAPAKGAKTAKKETKPTKGEAADVKMRLATGEPAIKANEVVAMLKKKATAWPYAGGDSHNATLSGKLIR